MNQINVKELKKKIDSKEDVYILDIREERELRFGSIPNHHWIPMSQLRERVGEVPKNKPIVVYCKVGERSSLVVPFLESEGYNNVFNLTGGILDWRNIDSSISWY
jgi:sulfur-carrier protein adenylyltransferase/sulfurtransferase